MGYRETTIIITAVTFVLALVLTAVIEHFLIPELHKLHFGQYIREEGPASHRDKAGTPTMGGIGILAGVLVTSIIMVIVIKCGGLFGITSEKSGQLVIYGEKASVNTFGHEFIRQFILLILLTFGYGIIGFIDDMSKIRKKENEGLTPSGKMALQLIVTIVFMVLYFLFERDRMSAFIMKAESIWIPFIKHPVTMPAVIFVIFLFFVLLGTDNGTNLTDGLDGLLSLVTLPVCLVLGIISQSNKSTIFTQLPSAVLIFSAAWFGALCGFLIYNHHPAKVFMGDTGSLAIGGYVASAAVITHTELYIILFGFVFLTETLTVIMQVTSYKLTGKRIFPMTPVHHSFEKIGWKETKIVALFGVVSVIACIVAVLLY